MAAGLCCREWQRHHQTQSRMTDYSNNIPPPVQKKVKSPSMTRQPWPSKAVIDHCTSKEEASYTCMYIFTSLPKNSIKKDNPLVLTQLNNIMDTN